MTTAKVSLRALTAEERRALEQLAHSRTAQARLVERAQILTALADGRRPSQIARELGLSRPTVYTWIHRFNEQGLHGLEDRPRSGRPHTYTGRAARRGPRRGVDRPDEPGPTLRLLDAGPSAGLSPRAQGHRHEAQPHQRDPRGRGAEVAPARDLVRRAGRSPVRRKEGVIERLYTAPPPGSVVVCLDEMGPESARSFPGQQLVRAEPQPVAVGAEPTLDRVLDTPQPGPAEQVRRAERAKQEIDYGRRGKGYIFGAFRPATGDALTHPDPSRSAANWADFLARVEAWVPAEVERIYAIVDNLQAHRAVDVLLFALAFARWEFVSQPKYAAYLNLIEPWWKVLRSLALKGRRFETWDEVCRAVEEATAYWNKHRHPFLWGRRRRHRPRRRPGIASVPGIRALTG